ncbi:MAG: ABC transporter substrate-binding protein [Candidatus Marinimicrobia bacterium]|nr:ABC transporter substrate-binding protein [Candidatus Neomarinimicrobiota bacterium]
MIPFKSVNFIFVGLFILFVISGCVDSEKSSNTKESAQLKFGILPVIQALPLFVAAEKGYFDDASLEVELVSFRSAMEINVALTSGQISGYFGGLITPVILKSNSTPIRIAASFTNTVHDQRMFVVLQPPNTEKITISEAAEMGIATSSNTVVDYFIYLLLDEIEPGQSTDYKIVETKNISIRLQLLLSGQFAAAVLSEPLATFAEMHGAQVIEDDRGMPFSITTLSFTEKFLNESPEPVKNFLKAVKRSIEYINANPDSVRQIMNTNVNVPKELQNSMEVPKFPFSALPDREQLNNVISWLKLKNIIKTDIRYEDLVVREQ